METGGDRTEIEMDGGARIWWRCAGDRAGADDAEICKVVVVVVGRGRGYWGVTVRVYTVYIYIYV